jgi:regulator of RNase E activity RraA
MTTTPDDLAARLAALDDTVVSDALDGLGLPPGVGEIIARWGSPAISGRVRTIELEPDRGGAPGPHIGTSVIASARPGEVLVVANGGRTARSAPAPPAGGSVSGAPASRSASRASPSPRATWWSPMTPGSCSCRSIGRPT